VGQNQKAPPLPLPGSDSKPEMDSNSKGTALEQAVRTIERIILRDWTGTANPDFRIEVRRVVTVAGVRHEIDVWVELRGAPGYGALYIFECKNQKKKVSKNDILAFSEKIRVVSAARGYFVAKQFSQDAIAQAKLDSRIELLTAEEAEVVGLPAVPAFVVLDAWTSRVNFIERGGDATKQRQVPMPQELLLDGAPLDASLYLQAWVAEVRDRRLNAFDSVSASTGNYELEAHDERVFEDGRLFLDGAELERVILDVAMPIRVLRPAVVSHFHVIDRGRTWALEPIAIGDGNLSVAITTLDHPARR
jgi:Restriction endonuclease